MKSLIYLYVGGALCLLWANYKYRIVSNKDVFNKKQAATIEITNSSLVKSHLYKLKSAEKSALNVSRKLSSDPNQVTYIIERENKHINDVMVDYPFKNGTKLDDYVYEMGGNPIKAIVSGKCKTKLL